MADLTPELLARLEEYAKARWLLGQIKVVLNGGT